MELVKTNDFTIQDNVLEYENLTFYVIDKSSGVKIDHLMGYDGLIIEAHNLLLTRYLIGAIRIHYNPEFYLKPVFLLNLKDKSDPVVNQLVDGVIYSLEQVKEIAEKTRQIFLKTTQLDYQVPVSYEAQIIKKVLNFMFTRDRSSLSPVAYPLSAIGYSYPEISVNYSNKEEHQVLNILELAEREGLLSGTFFDRVYLCNGCSSGFLNYREVCPHCDSSNSTSEDLIHHFPCAYIGPLSDFTNEIDHQLYCPKCNKTLRHIGVDYDKPSIIHNCKNCSRTYQDFSVKAKCISCLNDMEVQHLIPRSILTYQLTKKGESAAVNGFLSTSKDFDEVVGTVALPVFKTMLQYEIERIKAGKGKSQLAVLYLKNASQLYSKIGNKNQKTLLNDLIKLIRANVRSLDIIAFGNASTLLFCFNDADEEAVDNLLKKITLIIKKLIRNNFDNFSVEIFIKVKPIATFTSAETQVEFILKDLFD